MAPTDQPGAEAQQTFRHTTDKVPEGSWYGPALDSIGISASWLAAATRHRIMEAEHDRTRT